MITGAVERREVPSDIRRPRSEEQIGSRNNYGIGNFNEPHHYRGYGCHAEKHPVQDTNVGVFPTCFGYLIKSQVEELYCCSNIAKS